MAFSLFKKKTKEEKKDDRYLQLTVKEVRRETRDTVSLVFELPEKGLPYEAGQFLTLIMTIDDKKVRRAYSLCSSPFLGEDPAVTVKQVDGGIMSTYVNQKVKAGDVIEVMKAMGQFVTTYDEGRKRHLVLLGGGSGITPLMSIAKSVLRKEPLSLISLVYCNRDQGSVIFREELDQMQLNYNDRLRVVHVLEEAPEGWQGYTGRLDVQKVAAIIGDLPTLSMAETEYFTCGPEPMMNIVLEGLEKLGIPREKIRKESFATSESSPSFVVAPEEKTASMPVKIILDGEEYTFDVPPNKSILETGLGLDIDMPYSCQSGLCTACRGKLLSGEVKMDEDDGLTQSEKEEGYVLCCVGHPLTDNVIIEIG